MPSSRRRPAIIAGVLAAAVALAFAVPWFYANVIADDAPGEFALSGSGEAIDVDGTWTVSDGSEAGYRVDEVLNGQDVTVVGRTSDVTGELTVADGALTAAEVVVDMTTVTTDSGARDGQFATSILNTGRFPEATFALAGPVDLTALGDGAAVELSAPGVLTVRDASLEVAVELQAQGSDGRVEVVGSIPVTFADIGIEAPDLGFVKVEDHGFVEFRLVLARS